MLRVGQGYDAHRLIEGRNLMLGGVRIPFEKGLEGWSDADVLIHAIMDSLLGAASLGDIGRHFPPDDQEYKDISSITLLKQTSDILKKKGWNVGNIDATIVAERPHIAPFVDQMKSFIGEALSITTNQISIKATTTEGMGFAGREEGIAAYAVSLIEKVT